MIRITDYLIGRNLMKPLCETCKKKSKEIEEMIKRNNCYCRTKSVVQLCFSHSRQDDLLTHVAPYLSSP